MKKITLILFVLFFLFGCSQEEINRNKTNIDTTFDKSLKENYLDKNKVSFYENYSSNLDISFKSGSINYEYDMILNFIDKNKNSTFFNGTGDYKRKDKTSSCIINDKFECKCESENKTKEEINFCTTLNKKVNETNLIDIEKKIFLEINESFKKITNECYGIIIDDIRGGSSNHGWTTSKEVCLDSYKIKSFSTTTTNYKGSYTKETFNFEN